MAGTKPVPKMGRSRPFYPTIKAYPAKSIAA